MSALLAAGFGIAAGAGFAAGWIVARSRQRPSGDVRVNGCWMVWQAMPARPPQELQQRIQPNWSPADAPVPPLDETVQAAIEWWFDDMMAQLRPPHPGWGLVPAPRPGATGWFRLPWPGRHDRGGRT